MIKVSSKFIPLTLVILTFSIACQSTTPNISKANKTKPINFTCKELRPEICTQEYIPVCATRDTGIRCITTPCPSTEKVTYPNACTACADTKVYSYTLEACQSNL